MSSTVLPLTLFLTGLFLSFLSYGQPLNQAVILQYHHVSEDTPSSTSVSPDMFSKHLNLIEESGFQVLPLQEVLDRIRDNKGFKQKTLAITFDDGYESIYLQAFTQLKARNWPFTVFVSPKAIDENHGTSMTWSQLKDMQDHGTTIANHSWQHLHLLEKLKDENPSQWLSRISADIDRAQLRLKQELNTQHPLFAYPYGEFDEALKTLLKEKGYIGFAQQSGAINSSSDFQALPRFPASGVYANIDTLRTKLDSFAFDIIEQSPPNLIRFATDPAPKLLLRVRAHDIRHAQSQCFYNGQPIPTSAKIQDGVVTIEAQFEGSLDTGRSRYNCTSPSVSEDGYYWFSMPFITEGGVKPENG